MGTKYGWPDLELFCPAKCTSSGHNEVVFIELKGPKGRMNESQALLAVKVVLEIDGGEADGSGTEALLRCR